MDHGLGGILVIKTCRSEPKFMNSQDLSEFVLQFCPRGDRSLNLVLARSCLPLTEGTQERPPPQVGIPHSLRPN